MPAIELPYPPVMFLIDGLLVRTLRLDIDGTVILTRSVTVLATFAAAALVALLAHRDGARWPLALVGAGMFLGTPFLDGWAFTTRADTMAVALSLLSALALQRKHQSPAVAAAIAVMAFFTKQTMVALPAAACLWQWVSGRKAGAATFAATWLALTIAVFGVGQVLTNGNLALNIILAHMNPGNGFDVAGRMFLELPRLLWLPVGLAVFSLARGVVRERSVSLTGWYWCIALAVCLYTFRGRGAWTNYFIEPAALSCVLATGALEEIAQACRSSSLVRRGAALAAVTATVIWAVGAASFWIRGGETVSERPVVIPEVAQAERILSEEPTFIVLAGKELLVSEGFAFSQMSEAGHYDASELVNLIRQRYFDLVIIRGDARSPRSINGQLKWPPGILRAIAEMYQVRRTHAGYWLYVPDRPR
ncbi:MAG TPA: hypothetical protein VHX16_10250 [Chloroflexota bacterium]|nr:hypothetical protein [Chloroflexota bacterium]